MHGNQRKRANRLSRCALKLRLFKVTTSGETKVNPCIRFSTEAFNSRVSVLRAPTSL
jgi:hypothetical protein